MKCLSTLLRACAAVAVLAVSAMASIGWAQNQGVAGSASAPEMLARGRYLVAITGCNDCHTAGYAESGGAVPESEWLTGVPVGFRGPWGTSYPANLRLTAQTLSEDQWIARARSPLLPPMPWFALRDMNDDDARALYRYIRSLGPAGEPAPVYVAPDGLVTTPVIDFVPHMPEAQAQAAR
jgi:mono/diheme cytochrome c family protein